MVVVHETQHRSSRVICRALLASLCMLAAWRVTPAYATPHEEWRQVMSMPRIGARFTTMGMDPSSPNNLFLGTEHSTILVSADGGRTWDERSLSPRQQQVRTSGSLNIPFRGPTARPPVMLGNDFQTTELHLSLPDVNVDPQSSGAISVGGFLGITQQATPLSVGLIPYQEDMLAMTVGRSNEELIPVIRITVCPGATYPLIVATTREVYGSWNGIQFYRLYAMNASSQLIDGPGVMPIADVDCAPHDPNVMVISTALGPVVSFDGGLTFSDDLPGVPGGSITVAAYDIPGAANGGEAALLLASEVYVYAGQVESGDGLQFIYPDLDDVITQPHMIVRSMVTTDSGAIWFGTDFGPRASFDDGNSFTYPGMHLFWATPIEQVAYGLYEDGIERIAVVKKDEIWATEDNGRQWYPMFSGFTKRSLIGTMSTVLESGERKWWVLSAGELWESVTSESSMPNATSARTPSARRAAVLFGQMPSLESAQDETLAALKIDVSDIESLLRRERHAALLPTLDLTGFWDTNSTHRTALQMITYPYSLDMLQRVAGFGFYLQATWHLPDLAYVDQTRSRPQLYTLREQVLYVVEDAWHEKRLILNRLRNGIADPVEAELLHERVEVLDAVMDTWSDQ